MAKRDYYEILGVSKSATTDEIRRAYRALARKFHPDVNKEPDAAKKFSEIQDAYEVLSDDAKRARFDRFGDASDQGSPGNAGPRGTYSWSNVGAPGGFRADGFDPDELSSIFEAVMGGSGGGGDSPFGTRGRRPSGRAGARRPPAEPVRHTILISFDRMANGGTESIAVSDGAAQRTIEVRIPKAIDSGTQLRIRNAVASTGADLILTVNVGQHPILVRGEGAQQGKGLDLFLTVPLTVAEATLGATVTVPGLKGRMDLAVRPRSDSGTRMRLRGQGLEDESGRKGDLYVTLSIVVPDPSACTPEQIAALRTISESQVPPRSGGLWG